jgi:YidC/Oxa1 family membrane protein insertase
MEKRLFLAVLISIAFLWAWAALAPRLFPELTRPKNPPPAARSAPATTTTTAGTGDASTRPAPATTTSDKAAAPAPAATTAVEVISADKLTEPRVETADFIAQFSNRGAQLISFRLRHYKDHQGNLVELVKARPPERTDFPFAIETSDGALNQRMSSSLYQLTQQKDGGAQVLTFRYGDGSIAVTKIFRLSNDYQFDFSVALTPITIPFRVVIGPGIRTLGPDERDSQFITTGNGIIQRDDSLKIIPREKAPAFEAFDAPIDYIGMEDNYFLTLLRPQKASAAILRTISLPAVRKEDKPRRELYAGLNSANGTVAGAAFFGPKQADLLDRHGLEKALQFGWFGIIARYLLVALIWINHATKNYGFAIIVLTIIIKIALYPLQHKSIVSMKKMQKMQPKMNAIKDKYKKARSDSEQRQKMNVEMMKLYQQEGISPMGGCLPILLQLPILWGFYGLLGRAIELRGAPFIWWIHDLSLKDPYYITPILMTATMFIQQLITPTTVDATQRRMFLMMPLFFGFLFKEFPSGLVLYWLVQNILTIAQQMIMNRYWKDHPGELNK